MRPFPLAALAIAATTSLALAQESMYTEAATMPGPGSLILREQFHYYRFGSDPTPDPNAAPGSGVQHSDSYELMTSIQYGLVRDLSLTVEVPVVFERDKLFDGSTDSDKGVADLDLMLKYRFYREDTGGVDTLRAAALLGASIASGDDRDFSSQSVNPMIGGVVTLVRGRHGFNQDLSYTFNTGSTRGNDGGGDGPDDALRFNSSYVFRLAPEAFTSETDGAWYSTLEMNGLYETNGDTELRWAPGLMYEGRTFGFEVMLQLPLWNEVDERAELDLAIGCGVRFLF